jgi:3-oxoacyl-[acyl-carrier-protein] synthase II
MLDIGILGIGCATPLGTVVSDVVRRLEAGESAIRPLETLALLPDPRGAAVEGPPLGLWLKRKKDLKMMPRAAVLALVAAYDAMQGFNGDPEELPIFVAVGREPAECDDAEAALVAMHKEGKLAPEQLADGQALYPPLLPLRTLPNMILAHISIAHGIRGENATFAGGPEAGRQALAAAVRWIEEGRAEQVLVGAAWAGVELASGRDRLRLQLNDPPGEAAIFLRLGRGGRQIGSEGEMRFRAACGGCGPVEGMAGVFKKQS